MKLQPFPRGSLLRNARTGAIVWASRSAIALPLLAVGGYRAVELLGQAPGSSLHTFGKRLLDQGLASEWFAFIAVGSAPLIFVVVFLLYRGVLAIFAEIALRDRINSGITDMIRGIAFGSDSDFRIGDVSPLSHSFSTKVMELQGALAEEMADQSQIATTQLIEKYRLDFFRADALKSSIYSISEDALTWSSLIHTSYFSHSIVTDAISKHIVGCSIRSH